jgi:hypothetical protein
MIQELVSITRWPENSEGKGVIVLKNGGVHFRNLLETHSFNDIKHTFMNFNTSAAKES